MKQLYSTGNTISINEQAQGTSRQAEASWHSPFTQAEGGLTQATKNRRLAKHYLKYIKILMNAPLMSENIVEKIRKHEYRGLLSQTTDKRRRPQRRDAYGNRIIQRAPLGLIHVMRLKLKCGTNIESNTSATHPLG
jgi:hypothetical protein